MERLQVDIAAEQKRIKDLEAKEHKRKIEIIGEYVYKTYSENGGLQNLIAKMDFAGHLKKPADRKLFGLDAEKPVNEPSTMT